jgi:hypothetical protein
MECILKTITSNNEEIIIGGKTTPLNTTLMKYTKKGMGKKVDINFSR